MGNRELEVKRLKPALAVLALLQIKNYFKSNEPYPTKISFLKRDLSRILGENTANEVLKLAERIFREAWKRAAEDPDITFFDTAVEMAGE